MTQSVTKFVWGRRHYVVLLMFLAVVIGYSDRVNISVASISMKEQLGWTQTTKGVVLSAFFVGYLSFMFIGGWLATRYGGKRILGIAVLWWSAFTLLTPWAAATSLPMLIAVRIGMGIGEAALFPAAYEMVARWSRPDERTSGIAWVNNGISMGTVIGLLATGWIVGHYAWQQAFYVFGVLGLVWTVIWYASVSNDPRSDTRMRDSERALYADDAAPLEMSAQRLPWRLLFLKPQVWALVITHFSVTWTLYMLLTWLPSYFRDAQGVTIANSGFLSAAPWLSMFLMTYLASRIATMLIRRTGRIAFTRKLIQSIGLLGSALLLLLAQYAHSVPVAVAIVCGAAGFLGFCWAGYAPNTLDLAPRHGGVLLGFSNTFATIPGIVGVTITGWLVDLTGTYAAAFALAAGVSVVGTIVYCTLGRAEPLIGPEA